MLMLTTTLREFLGPLDEHLNDHLNPVLKFVQLQFVQLFVQLQVPVGHSLRLALYIL